MSVVRHYKADFPGGPVVKNLPCNVGDTGSIPGRAIKIPHARHRGDLRTQQAKVGVGQIERVALKHTHCHM